MNISNLLEKIRATTALKSNRQIAIHIGVVPRAFTDWERGIGLPIDKSLISLSELAGEDPLEWLLWAHAERAADESSAAWNSLLSNYRNQKHLLGNINENAA